jgi:hypothetical protein
VALIGYGMSGAKEYPRSTVVHFGGPTWEVQIHVTSPILHGLKYRLERLEADETGCKRVSSV